MKTSIQHDILRRVMAAVVAVAAMIPAFSLTRVVIAGDRSCAGSADTTLISVAAPQRALMPATGLYLTPGVVPTEATVPYHATVDASYGAQTMVDGLHAVLSGKVTDDIEYSILSVDKPIEQWTADDLAGIGSPDYLVWMHGASDVSAGTAEDVYHSRLMQLLGGVKAGRIVLVQPANASAVFASRPASAEYDMPGHAVENAMVRAARSLGAVAVPSYMCEFGPDGRIPRAASMQVLGDIVGRAAVADSAPSMTVDVVGPYSVALVCGGGQLSVSAQFAAKAASSGFEVWRTSGNTPRRLNIASVSTDGTGVTIVTNERLTAGDVVVYGCTGIGAGRRDGCRGNLAAGQLPMPVSAIIIDNIVSPSDNIKGRITDTDGNPVAGVTLSDGYVFATTDDDGRYSMASDKKLGYVFYILPKGYEPEAESNGWQIKVHAQLVSADVTVPEQHDFTVKAVNNTNHIMVVGADSHLAARNQDKSQFKSGFIRSVKSLAAANPDARIYSTILGDLSWDQYWYANSYALPDFVATMSTNAYPFLLFPVMGNHDNDGATPAGSQCDMNAAGPFRRYIAPTYYSFNLGDVHYVVLDDIVYKNTYTEGKNYSTGIVGDRDYGKYYTDEQLEWLRHDLEMVVDKSTPVVVCFHIQNWALSTNGTFTVSANLENSASDRLAEILSDFPEVHMLSGHTHYNFHAHPPKYPNIHENNVAGICATWWWTGKLVGRHICKDGSPGGYAVYTANGRDLSWRYRSSEDDSEPQMRVYDMNAVKAAYKSDADILKWLAYDSSQTNYGSIADNTVYVNVFNYDTDWTVEVFEDGVPLTVKRIPAQDPLHVICYEVPRYKAAGTVTADFVTNRTNHMFTAQALTADATVTVRVTDGFGRVYTTELKRPGVYSVDM